jgi:hypothetical protein
MRVADQVEGVRHLLQPALDDFDPLLTIVQRRDVPYALRIRHSCLFDVESGDVLRKERLANYRILDQIG